MDKNTLRAYLKEKRKSSAEKDRLIFENICALEEFIRAKYIFTYISVKSEPDTREIIKKAFDEGKRVSVPYCVKGAPEMECREIKKNTSFFEGAFGIPNPENCPEADISELDLIIVPGLGFDESGARLGYGKGYYDRFLRNIKNTAVAAITYESQIVDKIPADEWDVKADIIITERRIIRTK